MPMIRQADRDNIARDAIVMHLSDLARQGDSLKAQAVSNARDVIRDAHVERERLVQGGHAEGFAVGQAAGFEEGVKRGRDGGQSQALAEMRERLTSLEQAWTQQLVDFIQSRDAMYASAHEDVLQLSLAIAEQVIKRTIETDRELVTRQIRAVLNSLATPTRLFLMIHPEDEPIVRIAMPAILQTCAAQVHAEVQTSATIERGSCIARMARDSGGVGGEIDASISVQIERISASIMPFTGESGAGI